MSGKPRQRLKLLFADDEKSLQELMRLELPRLGHEVTVCPDGDTAMAALERNTYDCLLVDLNMPGPGGLEVIARAKQLAPDTEAIILTGKSSLETAVAALRQGTFDYLTKPCKLVDLEAVLNRVAEKRELTNKYRALKQRLQRLEGAPELIGQSAGMKLVRQLIAKVAPTNSTVLVVGETGTGKELVARALHEQSLRAEMPLVPVNCGALPENLIESELFGHRKGAFTGAEEHRVGLFEVAHGGTLFLDEIGELPKALQTKLLRFLESGEIRRVGDNESFTCDVRVLCATNRRLDAMVAAGEFREDLWFRINTFEIPLAAAARAAGRPAPVGPPPRPPPRRGGRPRRRNLHPRGPGCPGAAHLAGQRPRVGQRDRTGLDPLRRRGDRAGAPAAAAGRPAAGLAGDEAGAGLQPPRPGDAGHRRGAGSPRGQQAQGRRGTGDQPQDALQQAQPGRGAGEVGVGFTTRTWPGSQPS